jgi:hypothetical protein
MELTFWRLKPVSGIRMQPLATMNVESALWVQDALLIAASPELLEFVKHVLSQIESGACGYVDASEAELKSYAQSLINKAEGNEK